MLLDQHGCRVGRLGTLPTAGTSVACTLNAWYGSYWIHGFPGLRSLNFGSISRVRRRLLHDRGKGQNLSIPRSRLASIARRRVKAKIWSPRVTVETHPLTTRLGTAYGGWSFIATPDLNGCTVLSCGVGEDMSFDVEFAATFGASIVLVDPTPRAVTHFNQVISASR